MVYLKLKDGRIIEYPNYFKELRYDITYTQTQFALYCTVIQKPRVAYLDAEERVLYLRDELHPHPFVEASKDSPLEEFPVGFDVRLSKDMTKLIDILVINTPSKKHCLYSARDISKMADFPDSEGYGATWTDAGLIFVAHVRKVEVPDDEGEGMHEEYRMFPLRTARTGPLDIKLASLDIISMEDVEIDVEDGKRQAMQLTLGYNDALRELMIYKKDRLADAEEARKFAPPPEEPEPEPEVEKAPEEGEEPQTETE